MVYEYIVAGATVVITVGYLYIQKEANRDAVVPLVDKHKQTIVLPGSERIRRLNREDWFENGELITVPQSGVTTLYENFIRPAKSNKSDSCLGHYCKEKEGYVWQTYGEIGDRLTNFGSGLIKLGTKSGKGKIGIMAKNIPEWVITEQACNAYSIILVPLYDTLGDQAMQFIINQVELTTVVCDDAAFDMISKHASDLGIKTLIKIGDKASSKQDDVEILTFTEVEELGKNNATPHQPPKPDDIATIQYTSGTTGDPKGVQLSHKNMIADMAGAMKIIENVVKFDNNDTHLSYLPLAHSFERLIQSIVWNAGARVGFFRGDTRLILDDIKILKPSLFISVPRLLNRVVDKIKEKVDKSGAFSKALFYFAMSQKKKMLEKGIVTNESIWDRLVFAKVQSALGGNLKGIVSGAAPLSPKVMEFLRSTMGCHVVEGYGSTECSAAATVTIPGDHNLAHVGPPLPCCEIKLIDVEEMNYYAEKDQGEVCIRGPSIFSGYFANEEKTREAINEDGWLMTGDIGEFLENGSLKIIDRRKNIFKLAQGEYIAPEKVEEVYSRMNGLGQIYIHGTSSEAQCVAVVVPEKEDILDILKGEGIDVSGDYEDVLAQDEVHDYFLKTLTDIGKKGGLKSFEQAKAIYIESEPFSVENGLLTPTFKSKRPQLSKTYEDEIKAMYEKLN